MTFTEAVGSCFSKSFTWRGRASRSEFWYFHLFAFVISFLIGALTGPEFQDAPGSPNGAGSHETLYPVSPLHALFLLVVLVPMISAMVRRVHDQNLSGWWALVAFILPFAWVVLGVLPGTQGPNFYGPGEHARREIGA